MAVELNKLLNLVVDKGASDLHLAVGRPPSLRLHGRLRSMNLPLLTPEDTANYARAITSERHQQEIKEKGGCDFGFAFEKKARFRVSIFTQKGNHGLVLRLIPSKILSLEAVGLINPAIKGLLTKPRGLILVTGPTGCGKTTTLAAMINFINEEYDHHIITVEDPIEYYHNHKKSVITQRELHSDIGSFSEAITKALRMDPDVILVGEMRDLETIETAIMAAETGHLVFGTLHTTGAAGTVNRIIDVFPQEQQEQIRTQLASSLLAVISQMLLSRADKSGVTAAFEIMIVTSAIQHLIRDNQVHKIISAIQTGKKDGMILLDDSLFNLYLNKKITYEQMLQAAQDTAGLQKKVQDHAKKQQTTYKK